MGLQKVAFKFWLCVPRKFLSRIASLCHPKDKKYQTVFRSEFQSLLTKEDRFNGGGVFFSEGVQKVVTNGCDLLESNGIHLFLGNLSVDVRWCMLPLDQGLALLLLSSLQLFVDRPDLHINPFYWTRRKARRTLLQQLYCLTVSGWKEVVFFCGRLVEKLPEYGFRKLLEKV